MAALVLGGAGLFWWQRSQIESLRAQVASQGVALERNQERLSGLSLLLGGSAGPGAAAFPERSGVAGTRRRLDYDTAVLRADERRVILAQYRDVLAEMNLPETTAARLQDLLADRIEAFLDAQDAAVRVGFAEGSADMERAVALAIADDDRQIAALLGPDGNRRLNGMSSAAPAEPMVAPAPPAQPVVVTVVMPAPYPPSDTDFAPQPVAGYAADAYAPYFFSTPGIFVSGGLGRPFGGARPGAARPHRNQYSPRPHHG